MPNGRSGGFRLTRTTLEQLLYPYADDELVGKTLEKPVTASEMRGALFESGREEVMIEEQDHSWYIVHLPEWITVGAESPLFEGFRQHHLDWQKQWFEEWKSKRPKYP